MKRLIIYSIVGAFLSACVWFKIADPSKIPACKACKEFGKHDPSLCANYVCLDYNIAIQLIQIISIGTIIVFLMDHFLNRRGKFLDIFKWRSS